ncbi:MAG TPA: hypothetical protein VEB18_01065 [Candidatus Paceibacterota bacterium]|nr:hypothetical protein [Candidatus Paceibacterota bacterium]
MPDAKPTQSFVPVQEVRNGIVILKDGGYRGILMCSSINFALKSEDEQRAIIGGFQTFLNTLDFTVEIVVHSRKMDIRPYLALLAEREGKQKTELMNIQVREYIQFVKNFIEGSDIMTKIFYLVVPYNPAPVAVTKAVPFIGGGKKSQTTQGLSGSFDEHRVQLEQRMALVAASIAATGVRAVALGTEEVIELLYRSFNLGELETPIRLNNN